MKSDENGQGDAAGAARCRNLREAPANPASFTRSDVAYLRMLQSGGASVTASDHASAVRLGHAIVDGVTARPTDVGVAGLAAAGLSNGFSISETKSYIVAAVAAYRPDLLSVVQHYYGDISSPSVSWVGGPTPTSNNRPPTGRAYAMRAVRVLMVWISLSWKGRPSGPSRS